MTLLETTNPAAAGGRGEPWISFDTDPGRYRHWKLAIDGPVATLALDTAEDGGLHPGYALKLNSYDLGVDIELHDAVQRLRFEHPEVRAVVLTSAKDGVFCAGANIKMLAQASHPLKVNFCKLTNETRLAIEEASASSGQLYLAAVNGAASGGGYELALATEHILLVDDGSSAVSLPEVPLLGVLPGTGGLTRLTDKRKVRPDRADFVATVAEGVRGQRALDWGLVDELAPRTRLAEAARERAEELAAAAGAGAGRRPHRVPEPHRGAGPLARRRHLHAARPGGRPRGDRGARCGLVAAGGCARAGRRHPAAALQRAGDRHLGAAQPGRPRGGGGVRPGPD